LSYISLEEVFNTCNSGDSQIAFDLFLGKIIDVGGIQLAGSEGQCTEAVLGELINAFNEVVLFRREMLSV
jgi:hypothetical protein